MLDKKARYGGRDTNPGFLMSTHQQIQVPRFHDITGRKTDDDVRADSTHNKLRELYRADTIRYGYGTDKAKAVWRRRTQSTRSH